MKPKCALKTLRGKAAWTSLDKEIVGSILAKLLIRGVALLAGFSMTVILAREMGVEGLGIYTFCLAIIGAVSIPSRLGIPTVMMREISRYRAVQNWALMRGVIIYAHKSVALLTAVVLVIAYTVIHFLDESHRYDSLDVFRIGFLAVPLLAFTALRTGILQGLNRVVVSDLPENIVKPLSLICLLLLYSGLTQDRVLSPVIVISFDLIATFLSFMCGFLIYKAVRPSVISTATPVYESRRWVASVLPFTLMGALMIFNQYTDVLILGAIASPSEVGLYKVGYQVAMIFAVLPSIVGSILAPRFSAMVEKKELGKLVASNKKYSVTLLLVTLPITFSILFFGRPVLGLVFGEDFSPAYAVLYPLVLAQTSVIFFGYGPLILNMSDNQGYTTRCFIISAALNVILNAILIPMYAAAGAAIATSISTMSLGIFAWIFVLRRLNVNSSLLPDLICRVR
jgi:O-antigen/teichoic acid export membrane protein